MITSDGNAYIFTLATSALTTEVTGTADLGGFIDGYFVVLDTTESKMYLSALFKGTTWPALSVMQRSTAADRWVSMIVSDRQVHLYGALTSESWYNSGNPDFPLTPVTGSLIRDGIAAPYSTVALVDNTRIWLSANADGTGIVKRAAGYVPERISTHAVEHAIQEYPVISDAIAWSYQEEGHSFYVLSFPTARATWVYDATTQLWHERGWWNEFEARYEACRAQFHAYCFGKHLVGDRASGSIYEQRVSLYSDAGTTYLRRMRQGPHLTAGGRWIYFPNVRVMLEKGVGTVAVPDPQLALQWSDDGGHTWSNEHWVSAGATGEYGFEAVWRRCGRSQDRVFRLIASDPVPWRIFDMQVGD